MIFLFGVCVASSILLCIFRKYWSKTEVLDGKEVNVENIDSDTDLSEHPNKNHTPLGQPPNAPRMPRKYGMDMDNLTISEDRLI